MSKCMDTNDVQTPKGFEQCCGDCNIGLPCQMCGSNGTHIGLLNVQAQTFMDPASPNGDYGCEVTMKYVDGVYQILNHKVLTVCGQCVYFGPNGCKTSLIEAKYGSASTPSCEEFIPNEKEII